MAQPKDTIQQFVLQELNLSIKPQFIQQFFNSNLPVFKDNQKFDQTLPYDFTSFLNELIKERNESYTEKIKNTSLCKQMSEPGQRFLLRDTLLQILMVLNVSERKDSCATNSNHGCLKFYLSDGMYIIAVEVSKIPGIDGDLRLCRNKKILIKKGTKIQYNMIFLDRFNSCIILNSDGLISAKQAIPKDNNMDLQQNINNVNKNVLSMIDAIEDEDDEDSEDDRDYGDL